MEDKHKIQSEIKKTLDILNDVKKIEADAFFYTRVMAKAENSKNSSIFDFIFDSPILKPVIVSGLILINLLAFVALTNNSNRNFAADEAAELFDNEFYITQATESYFEFNKE